LIRSATDAGGVSTGVALGVTLPVALLTVFLMRLVLRSADWKTTTGKEEMLALRVSSCRASRSGRRNDPRTWRIVARRGLSPVPEGTLVRVNRVDGLKLFVEPKQA